MYLKEKTDSEKRYLLGAIVLILILIAIVGVICYDWRISFFVALCCFVYFWYVTLEKEEQEITPIDNIINNYLHGDKGWGFIADLRDEDGKRIHYEHKLRAHRGDNRVVTPRHRRK